MISNEELNEEEMLEAAAEEYEEQLEWDYMAHTDIRD